MQKKEKIKNVVIVILVLIIVFGGSFFASELKNSKSEVPKEQEEANDVEAATAMYDAQKEAEALTDDEKKAHKQISVADYLELKKGSKAVVIYVARPTCQYCQVADPILQNVAHKYDLTINYINTDDISDEDSMALVKSDDYFSEGYGTPLIAVFKDDKLVDAYEGLTTSKNYIEFLKKSGVINE